MTDLITSEPRTYFGPTGPQFMFPVAAAAVVFAGMALMEHTDGGVIQADQSLGAFVGFADEDVDNSAGAVADKFCLVREKGRVWLTVSKATDFALTDMGATVYCSDSNTFTLTSTNNPSVGKVVGFRAADVTAAFIEGGVTSAQVLVDFEGQCCRSI